MNNVLRKVTTFFSSPLFFYLILGFLVLEALWFVFSAVYPMAFDEDFHLGVIRIYAGQWSPFLSAHPAGADQFGAVMRDPSYLYHYLMSFPYRIVAHFTNYEPYQVVSLRMINVALFAWGVALFRRVLLRAQASPALTNVTLALFALIPIAPQLAAHINYDNLVMVLLPLLCLSVFAVVDGFRQKQVSVRALLSFIALSLGMSIVKYAALPFVVAAVLFLAYMAVRHFRGTWRRVLPSMRSDFMRMSLRLRIVLLAICAVGALLFGQRYVVNVVRYHAPVPDCGKVLSVEQCSAYGPWGRDYWFEQTKAVDFAARPLEYMRQWVQGMWLRTFFAVNGPASDYTNYQPLWLPSRTAIVIAVAGLLAVLVYFRKVFRGRAYLAFFALLIVTYGVILWFDEFGMYKQTAQPVAINGRYLLPVLPLIAVILGRGLHFAFKRVPFRYAKTVAASVALLLFLNGGGLFTFILRSDASWYWPSPPIQKLNDTTRSILAPLTVEGPK